MRDGRRVTIVVERRDNPRGFARQCLGTNRTYIQSRTVSLDSLPPWMREFVLGICTPEPQPATPE